MNEEFDTVTLMELCCNNRYAATVAGFEGIDAGDQIEISRKMRRRRAAVRAMYVLSQGIIKWDYIPEEKRQALREELGIAPPKPPADPLPEKKDTTDSGAEVLGPVLEMKKSTQKEEV